MKEPVTSERVNKCCINFRKPTKANLFVQGHITLKHNVRCANLCYAFLHIKVIIFGELQLNQKKTIKGVICTKSAKCRVV